MEQMAVQEIEETEDPLAGAFELISGVLEKGGYEPVDDTTVYKKSGDDAGFVFVPVGWAEARKIWSQCFIEKPLATENSIYISASLYGSDLMEQIACLESVRSENKMIPGLPLEKNYLRIKIKSGDYLQLPLTLAGGVYLGLGLVDENQNILPGIYFRDSDTLESLMENPKLASAVDVINSAEKTYHELLSEMSIIAEKENYAYHDGKNSSDLNGAITAPLTHGRQVVARLSTVTRSDKARNIPEIDGSVYLSIGVLPPDKSVFGMTPVAEQPVYLEATSRATLSHDLKRLVDGLRADYTVYAAAKEARMPASLFPQASPPSGIMSYAH